MYTFKKGILYKNGKKVFCTGLSYYASYHASKVPVPPEGDRIGEMKKDIKEMVKAGFNLVRFASLGDVYYNEKGEIEYKGDFVSAMAKYADEADIATMIRLQGYALNPSGYKNCLMVGADGKQTDPSIWYNFIQNSLCHDGILSDNEKCTRAIAKHFKSICNTACFQTYNEPHYPGQGMYDYHEETIKKYRIWLCENGIKTKEEVKDYNPPKKRPEKGESPEEWIYWRLFSMHVLSEFLAKSSDYAKEETGIETMTCLTTDPLLNCNAARGVNFYGSAERMDALGVTHYFGLKDPEAYMANLDLDMAYSAAEVYNKPMWIVEYDARCNIPQDKFRGETYMALGSGCKAIMYYQWRGDFCYPDSPEGNAFGLINFDGTPTANFENAKNVVRLINKLSDLFVNADKLHCGVGLLHSDYAYMYADAVENSGAQSEFNKLNNSWNQEFINVYKKLRAENISPDIVRACDLEKNPANIKVLYVTSFNTLSKKEQAQVRKFCENGGRVMVRYEKFCNVNCGYVPLDYVPERYYYNYEIYDTLELLNITAPVKMESDRFILQQTLKGDGYYIICITNISNIKKKSKNAKFKTEFDFKSAVMYTFENQDGKELDVCNNSFETGEIDDGAIIVLK